MAVRWRGNFFCASVTIILSVTSMILFLSARILASVVLEIVPPSSDLYGTRPFLNNFPNLWHILTVGLLPLIVGAWGLARHWPRPRYTDYALLYILAIVAAVGVVCIVAGRQYLGMVLH